MLGSCDSGISLEEFIDRATALDCARLVRCSPWTTAAGESCCDGEERLWGFASQLQGDHRAWLIARVEAKAYTFDSAEAEACLAEQEASTSCGDAFPSCTRVVSVNTRQPGERCSFAVQCALGTSCLRGGGEECGLWDKPCDGLCLPCDDCIYGGLAQERADLPIGSYCGKSASCAPWAFCELDYPHPSGVCEPLAREGEPCPCFGWLACVDGVCAPLAQEGDACYWDGDCESYRCEDCRCVAPVVDGCSFSPAGETCY